MHTNTHVNPRLDISLRRQYVDWFHQRKFHCIPQGARVADIGGHRDLKRGDFNIGSYDLDVVCVNCRAEKGTDVVADAADLPFRDNSFDVVLCSEVLEHVPKPRKVLSESYRVLRPGGSLLVCVPFLYHIHGDPQDYGRYTDHFWREALGELGFERIDIERQGLFWSVIIDMLRHVTNHWSTTGRTRDRLMRSAVRRSMGWAKHKAVQWDRSPVCQQHPIYRSFTTGFGIEAKKPSRIHSRNSSLLLAQKHDTRNA